MDALLPYRLWYETLQRSDPKRWSRPMRRFLGDAQGRQFEAWWELVSRYFLPPEPFTVVPIDAEEDATGWWQEYGEDPSVKLLYINLHMPNAVLVKEFGLLVRSLSRKKAGRPPIDQTVADFPLARPANALLIRKMLKCHDLHAQNLQRSGKDRRTLYQIGVLAGVSPGYVVRDDGDRSPEAADKRRLMAISTSRMVKRAEALIRNAEQGRFPVY